MLFTKWLFIFLGIFVFFCIIILVGSLTGEISISFSSFCDAVLYQLHFKTQIKDPIEANIIWYLRLPRAIIAAFSGAGLALCGAILQSLLRNSLADSYILGISSGACLGAVLFLLFGFQAHILSLAFGAFLGAVLAFISVLFLISFTEKTTTIILLAGFSIGQFLNAFTALLLWRYGDIEIRGQLYDWFLGSLSGVGWQNVSFLLPIFFISFALSFLCSRFLDAFLFSAQTARSLGVSLHLFTFFMMFIVSLLSAAIVSSIGTIGFIGIIVPHIARFFVGPRHHKLLTLSICLGALFMISADVLSRILYPGFPLPIGIVTAFIGAPCFLFLILRKKNYARS